MVWGGKGGLVGLVGLVGGAINSGTARYGQVRTGTVVNVGTLECMGVGTGL